MPLPPGLHDTLAWPFFEPRHRDWAEEVEAWATAHAAALSHDAETDTDGATRRLTAAMGESGLLRMAVPESGALDVRSLCLAREILARHAGLADFSFAMAGLGTGSITLFGSDELKRRFLPAARAGTALAAFALSEPEAGSDVAALASTATRDGDSWRLDGRKTWISNGGIAGHYVVFARTGEAPGARGLSAFVVPADAPGLEVEARIDVMAPHPLATLRFDGVAVPDSHRLGAPGEGFKVAMGTLDVFRATVGAAALGFARRAQELTLHRARHRHLFGAPLFDQQMTQATIADTTLDVETSALLVYRAAWLKDGGTPRVSREASLAKLHATEAASRAADRCVQLHGGLGVTRGHPAEELFREVRALRVYEGASEIQRIVIARAERDRAG
ncbi:acyl-CoA dehydrogenase family protein [Roseomonas sp. BN140053]|uniref:acyl-CoA dehydrogenase family protein n=1 Tax=Roseomonas sp. BN140053 TaxID=3391898 RepID=UPI0039ED0850